MKVAIAGGYGVFGARLAELLVRDGHSVVVTGRNLAKANEVASRVGCSAQEVDLDNNPGAIFDSQPNIVVDASGPFQCYGDKPYRLTELCIDNGVDYLDLSDVAEFTAGIGILDDIARKAGLRLLSGASTVPAITSSVAAELCEGFDEVLLIDSAVLPGNRAPRGRSVIASIVGQLGEKSRIWRGGRWRDQICWSDARTISVAPGVERTARYIEVPDIVLFPEFFNARSVVFRAGLELGILDASMRAIAMIRLYWPFEATPFRSEILRRVADLFLRFGTDRGGMRVRVVGLLDGKPVRREWRLVAEGGDGPYIPAVACRAVIRKLDQIPVGSRPCLAEVSRAEIEAAMADLKVSTEMEEASAPTLFQSALGEHWHKIPEQIRTLHSVYDLESFSGQAEVTRGRSIFAKLIAWLFRFPPASESTPVTVTKTRTNSGEIWERRFGNRSFHSYCTPSAKACQIRERFLVFNFELDLVVEKSSVYFEVNRGWLLGIPLPRGLLPGSNSREYVEDGEFCFDVALSAPLGIGLIVRYVGRLTADLST